MPIFYDEEAKGFRVRDVTEVEKEAFFAIAVETITNAVGEGIALQVFEKANLNTMDSAQFDKTVN